MNDLEIEKLKTGIGENIRRIRILSEVEVKQICADLEIAPSTYSNIERGVTDISVSRLMQLAEYFSVPFTRILVPDNTATRFFASNSTFSNNQADIPRQLTILRREDYRLVYEQVQIENEYLRAQNNKLLLILEKIG